MATLLHSSVSTRTTNLSPLSKTTRSAMAVLLHSSAPPVVASARKRKRRPSRRKFKLPAFPGFLLKRAFSSLASQLPPLLDVLAPPLINGSRRSVSSFRVEPLILLFSTASGSALGLNAKEIAKMKLPVVIPELGSKAAYFLLGFVLCFLICKAIFFKPRRRSGWRF